MVAKVAPPQYHIDFSPTPKQWLAWEALNDPKVEEVLFGGGAGSAKSYLVCAHLIICCQKFAGSRWLLGRAELTTLKITTLQTLFDLCYDWGLIPEVHYWYREQKGRIDFVNGSQILLKDLIAKPTDQDFHSLGSLEITGAVIEEVGDRIIEKAKSIVLTRCRYKIKEWDYDGTRTDTLQVAEYDDHGLPVAWYRADGSVTRGLSPCVLMTCNPCRGWPYTQFFEPWKSDSLTPDRVYIQALAKDNPHIAQSYIAMLEKADEATKQRLLYGNWEWDDDDAILMPYQNIIAAFGNSKVQKTGIRYIAADIAMEGADLMTVGVFNGLVLEKVYTFDKTNGKEVLDILKGIAAEWMVPMSRIVYDGTGVGSFISGFLAGAYDFRGAKGVKDNFANQRAQCFFRLAEMVNEGLIYFEDDVYKKQIAEELAVIRSVPDAPKATIIPKAELRKFLSHSPDFADMLSMLMVFYIIEPSETMSLDWL
jgi:hypothetical protein